MDCPLNNTFLLTFRTLVWRILQVRALTVVSCCGIFLNPSRQYSKRQTRDEEIEKCLDEALEPTYYFSIFNSDFIMLPIDYIVTLIKRKKTIFPVKIPRVKMIRRVLLLVVVIELYADYWALAQQIEVPQRIRTSSSIFQDSVDFKVRKNCFLSLMYQKS